MATANYNQNKILSLSKRKQVKTSECGSNIFRPILSSTLSGKALSEMSSYWTLGTLNSVNIKY